MVGLMEYFRDVGPDTVGVLGGFIGTGFMGGIMVKKLPTLTGWKAFFVRSLAKLVVGLGFYEVAARFVEEGSLEYKAVIGASAGSLLSIFTDGIETFTHIRLQAGNPTGFIIGAEKKKEAVRLASGIASNVAIANDEKPLVRLA